MINTDTKEEAVFIRYKWWIIIAVLLFGVGIILGVLMPDVTAELLSEELVALGELGDILGPFQVSTAVFIFFKNISALLFSLLLSPIFCFVPIIALVVNGWLLSFISVSVIRQESIGLVLAGILPHGVFELPAFIMGEAVALSSGALVIIALISKEKRSLLLPGLKQNLKYLLIACALLLPAAIIETYVTPLFLI